MDLKEHRHHSYVVYLMKQSNPGAHVSLHCCSTPPLSHSHYCFFFGNTLHFNLLQKKIHFKEAYIKKKYYCACNVNILVFCFLLPYWVYRVPLPLDCISLRTTISHFSEATGTKTNHLRSILCLFYVSVGKLLIKLSKVWTDQRPCENA